MKTSRIWASRSDLALSLSSASLLFFAHLLLSLFTCLFIILFFDLPHSNFFLSDFPLRIYPLFSPAHASLFSLPFPRIPSPFLTHIFVFSPSLPPPQPRPSSSSSTNTPSTDVAFCFFFPPSSLCSPLLHLKKNKSYRLPPPAHVAPPHHPRTRRPATRSSSSSSSSSLSPSATPSSCSAVATSGPFRCSSSPFFSNVSSSERCSVYNSSSERTSRARCSSSSPFPSSSRNSSSAPSRRGSSSPSVNASPSATHLVSCCYTSRRPSPWIWSTSTTTSTSSSFEWPSFITAFAYQW